MACPALALAQRPGPWSRLWPCLCPLWSGLRATEMVAAGQIATQYSEHEEKACRTHGPGAGGFGQIQEVGESHI